MDQNRPSTTPPPFIDPASVRARQYPRMWQGAMAVITFMALVLMFWGNAVTDTVGFLIALVESVVILALDREGFYTAAGLFKVKEWNQGQRVALAIAEVPFFFLALALYTFRVLLAQYYADQQPAPLQPPAKRRRPRP